MAKILPPLEGYKCPIEIEIVKHNLKHLKTFYLSRERFIILNLKGEGGGHDRALLVRPIKHFLLISEAVQNQPRSYGVHQPGALEGPQAEGREHEEDDHGRLPQQSVPGAGLPPPRLPRVSRQQ